MLEVYLNNFINGRKLVKGAKLYQLGYVWDKRFFFYVYFLVIHYFYFLILIINRGNLWLYNALMTKTDWGKFGLLTTLSRLVTFLLCLRVGILIFQDWIASREMMSRKVSILHARMLGTDIEIFINTHMFGVNNVAGGWVMLWISTAFVKIDMRESFTRVSQFHYRRCHFRSCCCSCHHMKNSFRYK